MKNIYILVLAAMSSVTFAQQSVSFETSEGFQVGTINGQNGWEVTEGTDGFITGQVISTEKASQGIQSFKNGHESAFDEQWFPIMGAVKTFSAPLDYANFTISYDVLVTQTLGSDFEFTLFAVDEDDNYIPIAGVGMDNRSYIYLIVDENYGIEYAEAEWTPNVWMNIKIEVTAATIKYYANNVLQLSIPNYSLTNIVGLNILHNNYGNDAYYDNFVITTSPLDVSPIENTEISLYPNPTADVINIQAPNGTDFNSVSIFNITGQEVKSFDSAANINISELAAGAYILQVTTTEGATMSQKIIKK